MVTNNNNSTIDRRLFLKSCSVSLGCALITSPLKAMSTPLPAPAPKPNILFIFSDDHANNTISSYGSKINKTPNIDRIAKDGAIFTNSFCTNSICQPSRAAILTGNHSHINGVTHNGATWNGKQTVFPRLLQKNGYQTALIGKWHMRPDPTDEFEYWKVLSGSGGQGRYYNPTFNTSKGTETIKGYSTDVITDEAIKWLDNRNSDKPFMLMTQFKSPHVPRRPPIRHLNLFDNIEIPEPETLYDDYSGRHHYASEAWMQISGLNEQVTNIFPPKGSDIPLEKWQKDWLDQLTDKQKEDFHAAYDEENAAYYKLKETDAFKNDPKVRAKYFYQRFIKDYLRCVTAVDDNVGRLLDYIEKNGLADNTVVVYSSDQSYYVGEHGWAEKRWMYEESLTMPFIIRWPKVIPSSMRIDEMIQNMDYAPTFLEMAGIKAPAEMQGMSLLPLLTGKQKTSKWRKSIYYHYYHHGAHNVPRHDGVRTDRYKLIHFYTDDVYEMYDLKKDPNELKSVYDEPAYKATRADLLKQLQQLRAEYEVPDKVFNPPYVYPKQKKN